jgi:hypothetical protein
MTVGEAAMRKAWAGLLGAAVALAAGPAGAAEKVILDSDFNTIGDDGQALVMLAQAMREGKVDLLGISVVTGNGWRERQVGRELGELDADHAPERQDDAERHQDGGDDRHHPAEAPALEQVDDRGQDEAEQDGQHDRDQDLLPEVECGDHRDADGERGDARGAGRARRGHRVRPRARRRRRVGHGRGPRGS